MNKEVCISIIIPFYNSKRYVVKCLKNLKSLKFKKEFEILMIDDGSIDGSSTLIKNFKLKNLTVISLKKNHGPAVARNYGIKKARGEFVFFWDIDDNVENDILSLLYKSVKENNLDFIFCDSKWIYKSKNLKKNIFSFNKNKILKNSEIKIEMLKRISNPRLAGGILGAKGKLINLNLLKKNNIFFEKRLRYLEDEIFLWDLISVINKAGYVKSQKYIYNVNPNVSSGVIKGLTSNFNIKQIKLIRSHIQKSFKLKNFSNRETKKYADQSYIYFIINILISFCKSIINRKINLIKGKKIIRKLIDDIISDALVSKAIINYEISKFENKLIPIAIKWKLKKVLEILCFIRAKEILNFNSQKLK